MKRIFAMGLFAMLFGCSEAPTQGEVPESSISQADIDRAALSALWPIPLRSALFPESDEVLDRDQKWVDAKRTWALASENRQYRNAYLRWIDHVERRIRENREENKTHARANKFKKYEAKRRAELEREALVAPNLPKPPN